MVTISAHTRQRPQSQYYKTRRVKVMATVSELEYKRAKRFFNRHNTAKEQYLECHPTGIGMRVIAVAKYTGKRITRDITDYEAW